MYLKKLKMQHGDYTVTAHSGTLHVDQSGSLQVGVFHSTEADRFAVELSPASRAEATGAYTHEQHFEHPEYAAIAKEFFVDGAYAESGVTIHGIAALVAITADNAVSIWANDASPSLLQILRQHFALGDFMR
jgi:hypothetical protein